MHETRNNGKDHLYYYYAASGSIGSISYNGVRYAFLKNLQGDVIAILDTDGEVVARYTYDAWGKVLSATATPSLTQPTLPTLIPSAIGGITTIPTPDGTTGSQEIYQCGWDYWGEWYFHGIWSLGEENFMIAELSAWRFFIKILSGGLIITILGLFTGCVNHDQKVMGIPIIESNVNIFDVLECEYSPDEIQNIMNMRVTLPELNEKYPVKCLKMHNDAYYAYYRSDENLLILLYDREGVKKNYRLCFPDVSCDRLTSITSGTSLTEVQSIDPKAHYTFLYAGDINFPKVSTHYTTDGYMVQITYDENLFVREIAVKLL